VESTRQTALKNALWTTHFPHHPRDLPYANNCCELLAQKAGRGKCNRAQLAIKLRVSKESPGRSDAEKTRPENVDKPENVGPLDRTKMLIGLMTLPTKA